MENPFTLQPDSSSYTNLKEKVFQNVQAAGINDRIFEIVQRTYDEAIAKENIVLSRLERKRLLAQIMKQTLGDMLKKLEGNPKSA